MTGVVEQVGEIVMRLDAVGIHFQGGAILGHRLGFPAGFFERKTQIEMRRVVVFRDGDGVAEERDVILPEVQLVVREHQAGRSMHRPAIAPTIGFEIRNLFAPSRTPSATARKIPMPGK